jgi:hypothetical protein
MGKIESALTVTEASNEDELRTESGLDQDITSAVEVGVAIEESLNDDDDDDDDNDDDDDDDDDDNDDDELLGEEMRSI